MINDQSAEKIQKISEAYVQVVKKTTGASMICMWGVIDPNKKVIGSGVSMTNSLEIRDIETIYFNMQRSLFSNIFPDDE